MFSRCAQLLLEGGADVNARSRESRLTPLHVAARRGLEEHVELLLLHGADVLATNQEGETPLNAACSGAERPSEAGRYLRVVQKLLDAGADPRTAGRKQHTPLHNACANCCPRIVEVLLQHGAKAEEVNSAGFTPLDCLMQVQREGQGSVTLTFGLNRFLLLPKVLEDYPNQQPEDVARSLLNHGARAVPTQVQQNRVQTHQNLKEGKGKLSDIRRIKLLLVIYKQILKIQLTNCKTRKHL